MHFKTFVAVTVLFLLVLLDLEGHELFVFLKILDM